MVYDGKKQEFEVFDTKLEISKERDVYNYYSGYFNDLAKKLTEEYEKKYVEVNTCIEDVHNNGYDQGFEFISQAILKAIDILIEYKIYDISYEVFLEEYYSKYYNWNDIFDSIDNKYLSIIKSTEELDEYRTSRRENR